MIRIVKEVLVKSLDHNDGFMHRVRMVPGTASYSVKTTVKDNGTLEERTVEFVIPAYVRVLRGNLVITVCFDDGKRCVLGTKDLPARFEFKEDGAIKATCKWQTVAPSL